jgi:hypothetical protein
MHDTVTRLANLPLISVCLVRGRAIGGGAELTLSTDFRVFAPTGKLNFVQARLGVLPGWAGGSKLVCLTICVKQFVIICNLYETGYTNLKDFDLSCQFYSTRVFFLIGSLIFGSIDSIQQKIETSNNLWMWMEL